MSNLHSRVAILLLTLFLATTTTTAPAATGPFVLLHSLFDSRTNAQAGAQQGYSVAVDGNIAVVGAPFDNVGGYSAGVVKVYEAMTGALLLTLTNPSRASPVRFGAAVSISGTRIVVGAEGEASAPANRGRAYVYDLSSGMPAAPVATLTNPAPALNDGFGLAVGISGTRVVVTAPRDLKGSTYSGRAYVYDLAGVAPLTPSLALTNPSATSNDRFGQTAAISGTRVVIGTSPGVQGDSGGANVYVYDVAADSPALPVATLVNPGSSSFDYPGSAVVAISGQRVVVGVHSASAGALQAGVAHIYDMGSLSPSLPSLTLTNPNPAPYHRFGIAVAIAGSRVVVGAAGFNGAPTGAGSGYAYDLDAVTPTVPVQTMTNPTPAAYDGFGSAVAVAGTRVVFGAPQDDTLATDTGSAYVYELGGTTLPAPAATLNSPSPNSGVYFGRAVALSGTRVVVGTSPIGPGEVRGIVYVYDFANPSPTTPILTLTNPIPSAFDFFGTTVGMDGTRIVIGAYGDDTGEMDSGRVFVYDLSSITPAVPVLTLTNPTPARYDDFGYTVAISGTRVVVGAWSDDSGAEDAGIVYVYDLARTTPEVPAFTLHNPNPSYGDGFGLALAIDGNRVVVGARRADAGANDAGRAYVYDLARVNPTVPLFTMDNPNRAPQDFFGSSVAISGSGVVVGASWDAAGANSSGSAYVYHLDGASPSVPVLTLTNPSPAVNDYFGDSVAISGTRVVIGVASDDTGAVGAGSAYVYDLTSPTPTLPIAVLTRTYPDDYDFFGSAVAIEGTTIIVGATGVDTIASARGAAYIFGLAPTLRIIPAAPGFATLSWSPATSSGFTLQYAGALAPTNWFNALSGETNPVPLSLTNGARFFRLRGP